MLIKTADDKSEAIALCEQLALSADPATRKHIETDLRNLRSGIKGENESAYLIDFHFGNGKNWMVLHDLRIEFKGQVAQIDHLLINRWMECYVLETKHFHAGFKINDAGEFERWNDFKKTFEGMASPLQQNERHIHVLQKLAETLQMPTRLGIPIPLSFNTLILVSSTARISRPKNFDTSRVIKADQLKERLWKDVDDTNPAWMLLMSAAKLVGSESIELVAKQIVAKHQPIKVDYHAKYGITKEKKLPPPLPGAVETKPLPIAAEATPSAIHAKVTGLACKQCQGDKGEILYGKYGYYFVCSGCKANTAIKFACEPGHQARLRKEGLKFFRECDKCKSSELYFTN